MGFFKKLGKALNPINPAGNNFLGLGKTPGRIIGGLATGGASEVFRPDPYGAARKTFFAKTVGGSVTGSLTGAGVGFVSGGPLGAIVGGVVGGIGGAAAGATGASNNFTIKGVAKNFGIGVGAGLVGGGTAYLLAPKAIAAGTPGFIGPATEAQAAAAAAKAAAATGAAAASSSGTWGTLGTAALLSVLNRPSGQPGGSVNPNIELGQSLPGGGPGVMGSTPGAIIYPSVPGSSGISSAALAPPSFLDNLSTPTGFFIFTAAAGFVFFVLLRKKIHV